MKKYSKEQLFKMDAVEVYKLVLKGDLRKFPDGFWQRSEAEQNAIKITKYFLEEQLKWNDNDIKNKLKGVVFRNYKLRGMVDKVCKDSTFSLINLVYPNKFKPWDLTCCPKNYWTLETATSATKWLIEDKLKWNDEDIKNKLTIDTFKENNLAGMMYAVFNHSPILAINSVYPNKFKPWEFKNISRDYWTNKTARLATKWLIEKKLKWNDEDIKNKLTCKTFLDNNLNGMLYTIGKNSPYKIINNAYPNRFKPWELSTIPVNYWTIETSREATRWLIKEKLETKDMNEIKRKDFIDFGLRLMLDKVFKGSVKQALLNADLKIDK